MIHFRRNHPALRPVGFYSSVDHNGNAMEQLRWFKPDGYVADAAYFTNSANHAIAWRLDGSELGDTASAIYVAYNAWSSQVNFSLPWPGYGKTWYRVTDTCAWARTGAAVRKLRESAGLTITELGVAIDLQDPSLVEALENGRLAVSFELILRLAAVFGRKDPVGFVMGLTRTANPELWKSLEDLGVGKLVLQTVREHQFVNICRSNDDARSLSDEEFTEILSFTQAAFAMAMAQRARYKQHSGGSVPPVTE